jgi:hypothetical protein
MNMKQMRDSYLEQTQWTLCNQAMLVVDLNGDGQISVGEMVNLQAANDDCMKVVAHALLVDAQEFCLMTPNLQGRPLTPHRCIYRRRTTHTNYFEIKRFK